MAIGGSFTGISQLEDILSLMADSGKFTAKVQELKDLEARAQKIVELAGPADQIVRLRAEVESKLQGADQAIAKANADAAAIVAAASKKASETAQNAEVKAQQIVREANAISEAAKALTAKLDRRVAEVEAKERSFAEERTKITAEDKRVRNEAQQLLGREQALNDRIERFKRAQEAARVELG
jgi:DNA repair exonuclease SbcCD ATPase subunit